MKRHFNRHVIMLIILAVSMISAFFVSSGSVDSGITDTSHFGYDKVLFSKHNPALDSDLGHLYEDNRISTEEPRFMEVFSRDGRIEKVQRPDDPAKTAIPKAASAAEAKPFDVEKIVDNGPDEGKVVLTLMGDGFTASEQDKFIDAARKNTELLLNEYPYSVFKDRFNVYAIKVISQASGAASHPSNPIDNYFGTTFNYGGIERSLFLSRENERLATTVAAYYSPNTDANMLLVNSEKYGGSATMGSIAVASLNERCADIMEHELAHSFGHLMDEYWAPGYESAPNKSTTADPNSIKWKSLLGYNGVGIYPFEEPGAEGYYRPHQNCKMRYASQGFCAVCSSHLIRKMAAADGETFEGDNKTLTKARVPRGADRIPDFAYYGCSDLRSVVIAPSVTEIGENAFFRCTALTEIISYAPAPPKIRSDCFREIDTSLITITVPAGSKEAYRSGGWNFFKDIVETAPPNEVKLEISSQPSKMDYVTGQKLELEGLSVKLFYSDNSYETINFSDFAQRGVSTDFENGESISVKRHNGKGITVGFGNLSAVTESLIVSKAYIGVPTLQTPIYDGAAHSPVDWDNYSRYFTVSGDAYGINAGDYTALLTLKEPADYLWVNSAEDKVILRWKIAKRTVSVSEVAIAPKVYDGTTEADVSEVVFEGLPQGVVFRSPDDFIATAVFDSPEAGTGKSVSISVALTENSARNYVLTGGSFVLSDGKIEKAAPEIKMPTEYTRNKKSISLKSGAIAPEGAELEYAINKSNHPPVEGWQSSPVWDNLEADTEYYVFARIRGENYDSAYTAALVVRTESNKLVWALPVGFGSAIAAACVIIFIIKKKKRIETLNRESHS